MQRHILLILLCSLAVLTQLALAHGEEKMGAVTRVIHVTNYKDGFLYTSDPNVSLHIGDHPQFHNQESIVGVNLLVSSELTQKGEVRMRIHDPKAKGPFQCLMRTRLHNLGDYKNTNYKDFKKFYFDVRGDLFKSTIISFYDDKGLVLLHCHKKIGEQDMMRR